MAVEGMVGLGCGCVVGLVLFVVLRLQLYKLSFREAFDKLLTYVEAKPSKGR